MGNVLGGLAVLSVPERLRRRVQSQVGVALPSKAVDSESVGISDGDSVGDQDGDSVGECVGSSVGNGVGSGDGARHTAVARSLWIPIAGIHADGCGITSPSL